MSAARRSEAPFETDLEAHLLQYGYVPMEGEVFDQERAIFPETVLTFIRETQPKEWVRLESLHGDRTGEQFLGILCKWMDIHGSLATLRHGFKCYGRTLRAAYFKAAHELNPELESRYAANRLGLTRQLHFSPRSALRPEVGGCHAEPERHTSGHGGAEGPAYGPMGSRMRAGSTSRTAIRTRCDQGQQLDAEHRTRLGPKSLAPYSSHQRATCNCGLHQKSFCEA